MGNALVERLKRAGVVPANARRVVIAASLNQPVHVFFEGFGDDRLLEVITPESLAEAIVLHVEDLAEK
jgi:hypothetical protein